MISAALQLRQVTLLLANDLVSIDILRHCVNKTTICSL